MKPVILAGGGLANSLIAWRLAEVRPDLPLLLLESGPQLGGNHTWSFHGSDLAPAQHKWMAPLLRRSWACHEVRFPNRQRIIAGSYHSLDNESLHAAVSGRLGERVRTGAPVRSLASDHVVLEDGSVLEASLVIDGRGAQALPGFTLAWQKFVGQLVELDAPHGLDHPVLMDATVEQHDGYRFIYLLPFSESSVLVEDTYYSDASDLDAAALRERIATYLAARGWRVRTVEREESGVLPIVLEGNPGPLLEAGPGGVVTVGMRAGLFHGTTGYSLPQAVALADALAALPALDVASAQACVRQHVRELWRSQRVFRLLNRLLFRAADPGARWRVLEHFYRLPEPLIGRFYAGRLQGLDSLRILSGRPPVPVSRALRVMLGRPAGTRA
ncbi:MAG: lycopene beta-cyclase CrtY [Chromatiales bacterium]|nr:lycopene beta-cyclase CrtY [Chromatiales bacterium]